MMLFLCPRVSHFADDKGTTKTKKGRLDKSTFMMQFDEKKWHESREKEIHFRPQDDIV